MCMYFTKPGFACVVVSEENRTFLSPHSGSSCENPVWDIMEAAWPLSVWDLILRVSVFSDVSTDHQGGPKQPQPEQGFRIKRLGELTSFIQSSFTTETKTDSARARQSAPRRLAERPQMHFPFTVSSLLLDLLLPHQFPPQSSDFSHCPT